jgi:transcriptional regulator with XRE-family HTH domain
MRLAKPTTASMTVGERIRIAREKLGISQVELAKRVGVSRGSIFQWENDRTQQIRKDKVPRLAAVLGLDVTALSPFGGGTVAPIDKDHKTNYVVLMRWNDLTAIGAGGKMKMSALKKPSYIEVDIDISPESKALIIEDSSMAPGFCKGDKIIIDPNEEPVDGDHVLARLTQTGEHVFRLYEVRSGGAYLLTPENTAQYPVVTVNAKFPADIMGVLVEHRKKRRKRHT